MYAAELRPRAEPEYVHSLGCDPVKFSQDLGRANLTLAFTQNRRLFASKPTSNSRPTSNSHAVILQSESKIKAALGKNVRVSLPKAYQITKEKNKCLVVKGIPTDLTEEKIQRVP